MRFLSNDGDTDAGFNLTVGADVYPVKPLVVSTSFDVGTLGSAGVFHGRATASIVFSGWELFGGYDYMSIGSAELQGPVLGVRLWF